MTPQETLAWEATHRRQAALAAFAAAILTLVGVLLTTVGQPSSSKFDDRIVTVVDAMSRTAAGQPVPPGRISAYAVDVGQHPALPIAGAVLYALGSLAIFFVIAYLFRAARARRPNLPQAALILAAAGAVGFAIGRGVAEIARYIGAAGFVDSADKTNSAAADALSPGASLVGQVIWQVSALALGFAFVLVALNAMRVGLLSRFMGVLGIIVGVTFVLPIDQQGIIRIFWLAAIGLLILGRWPSGVPKAWATGEAEPWPTQQQLREQRDAARAERQAARGGNEPARGARGGKREAPRPARDPQEVAEVAPAQPERKPPPAPAPTAPTPRRADAAAPDRPHSSSKKKKRKRRM
jgi:MFS family permease